MSGPLRVERADLYERIWTSPIQTVAKELGISDVALAKVCKKLNVPRPPRGHWAKVRHGARTKRPVLPKLGKGDPTSAIVHAGSAGVEVAPRGRPLAPTVPVPERGAPRHPLVRATVAALTKARRLEGSSLWLPDVPGVLAISVTRPQQGRAFRILSALLKALESRGHAVEIDASKRSASEPASFALIDGERIYFRLRELLRQKPREPTTFERLMDARRGGAERTYTENVPSGDLQIELSGEFGAGVRTNWSDRSRKTKRLEDLLGELVVEFEVAAEAAAARREEQRRWEEASRQRELEAQAARRREAHQKALVEDLHAMTNTWVHAEDVCAFLAAARGRVAAAGVEGAEVEAWFEWAEGYAARLDPLSRPETIAKRLTPGAPSSAAHAGWSAPTPEERDLAPAVRSGDSESNRRK